MKYFLNILIGFILLTSQHSVLAKGVYQTADAFIQQALGNIPAPSMLWLNADDHQIIADILQDKFKRMRIRYWAHNNETVWILDEIGKEKPITIAVHIKAQQIEKLKVLEFRESRGDEVRHDFYADQFHHAGITDDNKLNQHIDGITGATMSVNATTKVAKLALWLNKKVQSTQP